MGKLDDLLSNSDKNSQSYKSAFNDIKHVEIDSIKPNPYQPRREFDEEGIKILAENIRKYGLMQAINITDNYILISGQRRLRAYEILGIKTIECRVIKNVDNDKLEEMAIFENLEREDLNIFDKSRAIFRLVEKSSARDVAKTLGKSRGYIRDRIAISKIDDESKKYVIDNSLGIKDTVKVIEIGIDSFEKTTKKVVNEEGGLLKPTKKSRKKSEIKVDVDKIETLNDKEKYTLSDKEINLKKNYKTHNFEIFFGEKELLIRVDKGKVDSNLLLANLIDNAKIQNEDS